MAKEIVKKLALYISIIVGLYFLYLPKNKSTHNIPHSATSFVYAQF
jgi:hypothetical protein